MALGEHTTERTGTNAHTQWLPYDARVLAQVCAPQDAAAALAEGGLPENAYELFVRNTIRELHVTSLPECGRAAFLGQHDDGSWNTYWLRLDDGSVWLARGGPDQPVESTSRINSSVSALQGVLEVWCSFIGSGVMESDDRYDDLVAETLERARNADPEAFEDEESWWSMTFEEVENGILAPKVEGLFATYTYSGSDPSPVK